MRLHLHIIVSLREEQSTASQPSLGFEPAALPPRLPESRVVNPIVHVIYMHGRFCIANLDRQD
jgi:hypothetical protein